MLRARWRDPDLTLRGVVPYDTLTLVPRFNGAGTWSMELSAEVEAADWMLAGGGIVVADEDNLADTVLSGPVRKITERADEGTSGLTLAVSGVDDTARLLGRRVYPNPALAVTAQDVAHYDATAADAETALRALVNLNAGPGALTAREIPGLVLAGNENRGPAVAALVRFTVLLDTLRAIAGVDLGFRVVQVGTTLEFQVYEPVDRSATARFSRQLGNLLGYSYGIGAPEVTTALVGGSGDGAARVFVERADAAAETEWGERFEDLVDRRDTDDTFTLEDAGDEALRERGGTAELTLSPIDTPDMRFGVDYRLGDIVRVLTRRGSLTEVVREVTLTSGPNGLDVTPTVGSVNAQGENTDPTYEQVRKLARRVRQLEAGN